MLSNDEILNTLSPIKSTYPSITLPVVEMFRNIQSKLKDDPYYLQGLQCPYEPRVRAYLEDLFLNDEITSAQIEADVDEYFGEGKDDKTYSLIVRDAKKAYLTMTRLGQRLETATKPEEQLSKVKSLAQIQERLLAIIEKAEGLRQIHEFKRVVMDIMANVLTPDQRTQIMSQIENALKS